MKDEKFKKFTINAIVLVKKLAKQIKKESNDLCDNYKEGVIMGYYSIITALKQQAFTFCLDQKELGLADIMPDIDLLGLKRNPDEDFGEDNWAIYSMDEERVKLYLIDTIASLKEQAREAKKDARESEEGSKDYNKGSLMAYYSLFALFKEQAHFFKIDEKDLGLADIEINLS